MFKTIKKIIILAYSLYFCIRVLPLRIALKIPIKLSPNIKIGFLYKGSIELQSKTIKRGMIQIGLGGSEGLQFSKGFITIKNGGKLIFQGTANFGKGSSIRIDENALLAVGDNFFCNNNTFFRCNKNISIGNNVLIGWNCTFNDYDGHTLYDANIPKENKGDIKIGNHVWIAFRVSILKNTVIPDDCVVAAHSLLSKKYINDHTLIGGIPAKIIKQNISWKL